MNECFIPSPGGGACHLSTGHEGAHYDGHHAWYEMRWRVNVSNTGPHKSWWVFRTRSQAIRFALYCQRQGQWALLLNRKGQIKALFVPSHSQWMFKRWVLGSSGLEHVFT